jgi:hypothetical protein
MCYRQLVAYVIISSISVAIIGINPLNAGLNPICHLLALLGAHHIFHFSGLRVKLQGPYIIRQMSLVTSCSSAPAHMGGQLSGLR